MVSFWPYPLTKFYYIGIRDGARIFFGWGQSWLTNNISRPTYEKSKPVKKLPFACYLHKIHLKKRKLSFKSGSHVESNFIGPT